MAEKKPANYSFSWLKDGKLKITKDEAALECFRAELGKLTGNDYEAAERAERAAGNNAPMLTLTRGFQARLAAMAIGVPAPEVKGLPLRVYSMLTNEVLNFLYGQSDEWELESAIGE